MEDQSEAGSQPKENPLIERLWQHKEGQFQIWLTEKVGLTETMTKALRETDDDWTFVIKIHALIEVAFNHMLAGGLAPLGRDLSDIIERMNMQGRVGKTNLAAALGVEIPKPCLQFISLVSEVRRHLVHDIKNFDFCLADYMNTRDKGKLDEWKRALTFQLGDAPPSWMIEWSVIMPRFSMFQVCMNILSYAFNAQPPEFGQGGVNWAQMLYVHALRSEQQPIKSIPTEYP